MSSLARDIKAQIEAKGPMRFDDFMRVALFDPKAGYYTQNPVFGAAGDFITAPEISQMFGEMIGLAFAQYWQDIGAPETLCLSELGPGRGVMMVDILRTLGRIPRFLKSANIVLIEKSPLRQAEQANALDGFEITWANDPSEWPQTPLFCVANEFFDALPLRQFKRTQTAWRERHVGLVGGMLNTYWQPSKGHADLEARMGDTQEGDIVEVCDDARKITAQIGDHISTHGGLALIIDYGDWHSLGDTVQAVHRHRTSQIFENIGQSDITAHVDFEAIAHSAGCAFTRLCPQGVFLERLGITTRAQKLAQNLEGDALEEHIAAHRRLTHPDEMGALFKVLALYQEGQPVPVGLQDD